MNEGKYVFAQIASYIPRFQFDKIVAKYRGNYHAHELTCYNQFLHLLFGQITPCNSLRDICLCLEAHKSILYHLGFGKRWISHLYLGPTSVETIISTRSLATT